MIKVLIGIPSVNPDKRFIESVSRLFVSIKDYELEPSWIWDRPLAEAQNMLALEALGRSFSYLLLLEDDHWKHTPRMFYDLINAYTYVCAINYYSRHHPMLPTLMRKLENGRYEAIEETQGYHEVDLCGFGMTLIRTDVFHLLKYPFFRPDPNPGYHGTDRHFCDRLIEAGIKPMGCFNHMLNHRDITPESIGQARGMSIVEHKAA